MMLLEKLGHQADIVANGLEAIDSLNRQKYDLVLMDVQMPELDGLEATKRIRSEFTTINQPTIIAVTANAMSGDKEKCLEAGMNDYLAKPITLQSLEKSLSKWL
jgi:CheY-like chemotaxis protein